MATSPNATQITPPRVELIDARTGAVSREWYRWFYSLYNIVGGGLGIVPVASGGTGLNTIPTNGQLLIGNGTGYTLNTLGVGAGLSVTNGIGTITLANTGVLSFSGGTTGLTPSAVTTGAITLAGTLIAVNGGTGFASYAIGDLLYADTTTTLAKLPDVATGNALISGGVNTAPSWGKIGLTTHVSGVLPIANGGTNGSATPTAGAVPYGTGTAYGFTAAGTTGQVLTSAGAGVPTWTTPTTGTVTSVSFTGGIITVANPTTTPAFTVAGTSGGIPYFSSGTTWASSAALTQYGVVYGGGVGASPVATAAGTTGQVLTATTGGAPTWAAPATNGDVVGPASATDNAVARFNLTTGKLIQNSTVIIGDTGSVTGVNSLTAESLTVNDNSTFGTSNSDTINFVGRINSDFDPATDNTYDLGRVGHEWRDLYIDGTANIDSLIADTADINGGTIDNTTIGATTPQNGSFVDLSVTGTTSFDGAQGTSGQVLTSAGTGNTPTWTTPTTGTVTAVSVVSANGLAGTSSGGATPALTLSTSITGILKGNGTAISAAVVNTDYFAPSAPVTKTANFTVADTEVWLINNKSGSTCTVTLPTASSWTGRVLRFQNYQVQTVVSASSNVVPLAGGAAGTSILLASSGDSATLVSDGSNWLMTQYIPNNILLLE